MSVLSAQVKRWRVQPLIPPSVQRRLGAYHPMLAQLLYNRGQDTPEKARLFLEGGDDTLHNPFTMYGMSDAVGRIRQALRRGELIAVYGDFDADGVTSTVLLTQTLQALGGRVRPYIPNRVDEGYGLNTNALDALRDEGVRLVVTVDCGIRSLEEVAHGQRIGLDLIVTDHHSVGDELPDALAVIDPKIDARLRAESRRAAAYPEDMLAGVGVAYKLADALVRAEMGQARREPPLKLSDLLDLVALGTVADLVPLDRLENRELVRRGLEVLNRAQRPGIFELAQVAGVQPGKINTTAIGFMLAPRVNAAGRLDSAMIAYNLLIAEMPHAGQFAQRLQALNEERQTKTMQALDIARQRALRDGLLETPLIFDAGPEFEPGIVGLVAGRLCEEFYRPAVVVEQGEAESRGSCRSIPGFDITRALDECADLLVRHGGHAQAAGFTVRNENLPALRERLLALADRALAGQDLRPELLADAELRLSDITLELVRELQRLEPTGTGNETPLFIARGLRVTDRRRVGREGNHLRLRLSDGLRFIEAIAFKQGNWDEHMPAEIDVAFHLELNEWNGSIRLQLNVQDMQPAGASSLR
ncbi:MAG: single-stranded-DNA-specific exonuclease RecJ [Aggregatilineaceae bacterium]